MSDVFESCITSPFNRVVMRKLSGSTTLDGTTPGPSGQNVSNALERHHWPPPFFPCHRRALTSFAIVYLCVCVCDAVRSVSEQGRTVVRGQVRTQARSSVPHPQTRSCNLCQ